MKRTALVIALLALSTLAIAQPPILTPIPPLPLHTTANGYALPANITPLAGTLGDTFAAQFFGYAGTPPFGGGGGNFTVPCNQSGFDLQVGFFTAGCSISDVSGNTINTGISSGNGKNFFSLITPNASIFTCIDTQGCFWQDSDGNSVVTNIANTGSSLIGMKLTVTGGGSLNINSSMGTGVTGTGITDDGVPNAAVCWLTATTLGHCTSVVAVDGSCSCS